MVTQRQKILKSKIVKLLPKILLAKKKNLTYFYGIWVCFHEFEVMWVGLGPKKVSEGPCCPESGVRGPLF